MKNWIQKICITVLCIGTLTFSFAESVQKFGYVNPERIYTETQLAQKIELDLQKEFAPQQQKLLEMQQEGIKLQQELQSNKLSGAKLQQAEAKLYEASKQYRIFAAQLLEDYNLRRNEAFAALQNQANDVIRNIAEKEKYDLIVQEAVFVSRQYDLTDRVIKLLDEMK